MSNKNSFAIKLRRLILGYFFILIGVPGLFLPILQGVLLISIGVILLKDHTRWARWIFDTFEERFPKYEERTKRIEAAIDEFLRKIGLA